MGDDTLLERSETGARGGLLTALERQPADALLALIGMHRADPRADKIDVGVGVYRDVRGRTPVMAAVKAAEATLLAEQSSKSYLGPEGDTGFFELLVPVLFGALKLDGRLCGLQTPGGTGALRLGAELIAAARPGGRVHVGTPTWPNHVPLMRAGGLEIVTHRYFDPATQELFIDDMLDALDQASAGDVVLVHGCCHNPTGTDLTRDQWHAIADIIVERGLLPFVDIAYQGLGDGLDADAAGARIIAERCEEALIAYSCDKNFGLYRERTGALFAITRSPRWAATVQSNLLALARANWSMPPDHGAAIVRTILESDVLGAEWRRELDGMRGRVAGIRASLAALDPALAPLARQKGLFSTLPLSPAQIVALREDHAIYMAGSGRINIAGLLPHQLDRFVAALAAVRETH